MFVDVVDRQVKPNDAGDARGVVVGVEGHISADLVTGALFARRYRVERCIATGGMGAVYEVVHLETNRRRALKVMHAHYVSSDELRMRFRQEARVAAEIESEHIVDVFDAGIDEATGMPFLVMELLRGEELGKYSKRVGPLPKEEVVRYLYETSLALDKTHRARIVHRDLKPDNLFLCEREHGPPRVKVLDFGIAKIVKDSETRANATRSLGTPLYMAPEQFQLKGMVSAATDIFALGMIAFTLLVGKPYWHPESTMASEVWAFAMHVATGPQEPAVARAWELFGVALPRAFDAWFVQATASDPHARFASAGEAVHALAEVLGVALPTSEFAKKNVVLSGACAATDVADRPGAGLSRSANHSSRRTGPTMLAMTPDGDIAAVPSERRRAPPWVFLAAAGGVLVTGLGALLMAGRMIPSASPASMSPSAQPATNDTSRVDAVASEAAIAPDVKVAPLPMETSIATAASASAPVAPVVASAPAIATIQPSASVSNKPTGISTPAVGKVLPNKKTVKPSLGWER